MLPMANVLLYHHAQGLTSGVRDFAETLRADGHTVYAPDLYDGNVFDTLDAGIGYAKEVGFGTILERGRGAAEGLPSEMVYAGFSLGGSFGRSVYRNFTAGNNGGVPTFVNTVVFDGYAWAVAGLTELFTPGSRSA